MTEMTSYLGWTLDYANPPGAPAFLGPDSVHWRIYKIGRASCRERV